MAKSKHSAALFEVIKSPTPGQAPRKTGDGFWLAKWFKGRSSDHPTPRPSTQAVEPAPAPAAAAALVAADIRPRAVSDPFRGRQNDRSSAIHVEFSADHQELTLRMRYTTAMICAFTLLVLMGVAFAVGRNLAGSPTASALAPSAIPLVPRLLPNPTLADANRSRLPRLMADTATTPRTTPPSGAKPTPPPVPMLPLATDAGLPRKVGLNYAIIQTYPPEEAKAAGTMRDFLTSHGIACTLERTSYAKNANWVCLVGTAGFTKISSSEYRTYIDSIVKLGERYKNPAVDHLKPAAYKWKGSEDAG
jgi:hypothetical protein